MVSSEPASAESATPAGGEAADSHDERSEEPLYLAYVIKPIDGNVTPA